MYLKKFTHKHTCIHTYKRALAHTHVELDSHACRWDDIEQYVRMYVCIYLCMCACARVCVCVNAYVCMYS